MKATTHRHLLAVRLFLHLFSADAIGFYN